MDIANFTDYQLAFALECILNQCNDGRFKDPAKEQEVDDLCSELELELAKRGLDKDTVLDWDNIFEFD